MIFVTVGTHEQPFDRLIQYIDNMKRDGLIQEDVIIQIGYSTYEPQYCVWHRMIPYNQMEKNIEKARIVITHGGPASFIMPLLKGKIPIVVPRQKKFNEHVNDHQLEFAKAVAERQGNLIVIENIDEIKCIVQKYDSIVKSMSKGIMSNNLEFNERFEKVIDKIMIGDVN